MRAPDPSFAAAGEGRGGERGATARARGYKRSSPPAPRSPLWSMIRRGAFWDRKSRRYGMGGGQTHTKRKSGVGREGEGSCHTHCRRLRGEEYSEKCDVYETHRRALRAMFLVIRNSSKVLREGRTTYISQHALLLPRKLSGPIDVITLQPVLPMGSSKG